MFGTVGAYSWSGGIVQEFTHQMLNSSFINATNMEEDIKDSYLGMAPFINGGFVQLPPIFVNMKPRYKDAKLWMDF